MRFLADEGVDRQIVDALRGAGYPVAYILESAPGIPDSEVLELANATGSVLITCDKGFGELVFRRRFTTHGVVLFRLSGLPQLHKAHLALEAFGDHVEAFNGAFTVVTHTGVRIRKNL